MGALHCISFKEIQIFSATLIVHTHTHTHTHIYIYIYIYIYYSLCVQSSLEVHETQRSEFRSFVIVLFSNVVPNFRVWFR